MLEGLETYIATEGFLHKLEAASASWMDLGTEPPEPAHHQVPWPAGGVELTQRAGAVTAGGETPPEGSTFAAAAGKATDAPDVPASGAPSADAGASGGARAPGRGWLGLFRSASARGKANLPSAVVTESALPDAQPPAASGGGEVDSSVVSGGVDQQGAAVATTGAAEPVAAEAGTTFELVEPSPPQQPEPFVLVSPPARPYPSVHPFTHPPTPLL